jgi:hypothetical protein
MIYDFSPEAEGSSPQAEEDHAARISRIGIRKFRIVGLNFNIDIRIDVGISKGK